MCMLNQILISLLLLSNFSTRINNLQIPCSAEGSPLLFPDKPAIYITFEHFDKVPPNNTDKSKQGIWLRLHNNTRWAISVLDEFGSLNASYDEIHLCNGNISGLQDGSEAEIIYKIESSRGI